MIYRLKTETEIHTRIRNLVYEALLQTGKRRVLCSILENGMEN